MGSVAVPAALLIVVLAVLFQISCCKFNFFSSKKSNQDPIPPSASLETFDSLKDLSQIQQILDVPEVEITQPIPDAMEDSPDFRNILLSDIVGKTGISRSYRKHLPLDQRCSFPTAEVFDEALKQMNQSTVLLDKLCSFPGLFFYCDLSRSYLHRQTWLAKWMGQPPLDEDIICSKRAYLRSGAVTCKRHAPRVVGLVLAQHHAICM